MEERLFYLQMFQHEAVQQQLVEFSSLFGEIPTQYDAIYHDVKFADYTLIHPSTLPDESGEGDHRQTGDRLHAPACPYPAKLWLLILSIFWFLKQTASECYALITAV